MIFSSLLFLFVFLAIVLILYYIIPNRLYRNVVLCVCSLFFYAWGEPVCVVIMIISILLNYAAGLMIGRFRAKGKEGGAKAALIAAVVINLLMLGVFKYIPLIYDTLKSLVPSMASVQTPVAKQILYDWVGGFIPAVRNIRITPEGMLPIGISFYTFQAMSYIIDVYRGDTGVQRNPVLFGTYVALFPQLIAGPIVRYHDIEAQLNERHENVAQISSGIKLFTVGLAKKILIANQMAQLWNVLRDTSAGYGFVASWVGMFAYTLQIYFDFSGYSDMAIGLGRMFGFEFLKNFDYPYISQSISDFWRRWHISLSTWFKEYVYIPLGGNRHGYVRQIVNLLIVWALTGLWHGASWNFVLWGALNGVFICIEKLFLGKWLKKSPRAVRHIYTLLLVNFGWALFDHTDTASLFAFFRSLFSFGGTAVSPEGGVQILSYLPLMLIAFAASTPLFKNLRRKLDDKPWAEWLDIALVIIALVLCTSSLVASGYNPFIYFRF